MREWSSWVRLSVFRQITLGFWVAACEPTSHGKRGKGGEVYIHAKDAPVKTFTDCHGGSGSLQCIELLADYRKKGAGIKFVHDDLLEPGASIGEHTHRGDEEVYIILEGQGEATVNGEKVRVVPGDLILTRHGEGHGLRNDGEQPLRLIVVCANLGEADA